MIDIAKGRYWDLPWSLVDGCTPCSPGCDHCWSAGITYRFSTKAVEVNGTPFPLATNKGFTGKILTHPERLSIPLKRRKTTVYAIWNDWCHESVDHVFRHKMVLKAEFSEQHTILALTKRPQVMLDFWKSGIQHVPSNWWHGLTVCNQAEADAKIPVFLQVPGRKFLSLEPLVGPVKLSKYLRQECADMCPEGNDCFECSLPRMDHFGPRLIDAAILGGETLGNKPGRELKLEWAESVVDQCIAAGVPVFVKQLHISGRVSKDVAEWPEKLRRRELPWLRKDR